jgi:small-conductance mechanosensitive channel
VLLSARPFRVGDRVRLQGGPLAGQVEGTVSSLGLLYTTFATEEGSILVPNSVVLSVAVLAKERRSGREGPQDGASTL